MYLISIEILAIFVFMQTVFLFKMPFCIVSRRKTKFFKLTWLGIFFLILLLLGLFNRAVGEERGGVSTGTSFYLGLNTVYIYIYLYLFNRAAGEERGGVSTGTPFY